MWNFLDKANAVLGFVGFFISSGTFFLSLKVKSRVDEIIERTEYRDNLKENLGVATGFLDMLNSENLDLVSFEIQIITFSAEMRSRYSFLPFKIKRILKKFVKLNTNRINSDKNYTNNLRQEIIVLKNYLEKEARK